MGSINKERLLKNIIDLYENHYPTASGETDELFKDITNLIRNTNSDVTIKTREEKLEIIKYARSYKVYKAVFRYKDLKEGIGKLEFMIPITMCDTNQYDFVAHTLDSKHGIYDCLIGNLYYVCVLSDNKREAYNLAITTATDFMSKIDRNRIKYEEYPYNNQRNLC